MVATEELLPSDRIQTPSGDVITVTNYHFINGPYRFWAEKNCDYILITDEELSKHFKDVSVDDKQRWDVELGRCFISKNADGTYSINDYHLLKAKYFHQLRRILSLAGYELNNFIK